MEQIRWFKKFHSMPRLVVVNLIRINVIIFVLSQATVLRVIAKENKTSSLTRTSISNSTRQLINKDGHETKSPSMMSDIYNLLHNQDENRVELPKEMKFEGEDKEKPKTKVAAKNKFKNQVHRPQPSDEAQNIHSDTPQAIALGSEIEPFNGLLTQHEQYYQHQPSNQQVIAGPTNPSDNVIARLYIDSMGNQYVQRPEPYQQQSQSPASTDMMMNPQQYAASDQYTYGPPSQAATLMVNQPPVASSLDESQLNQFYGNPTRMAMMQYQRQQQEQQQQQKPQEQKQPSQEASSPEKSKLSNAQLMTLIDELKDFNNKQATKILSRETKPPSEEETSEADDDPSEEQVTPAEPVAKSALASARTVEVKTQQEAAPQMDAEDLSKFAKFLLSKEGSNMRFQLGLEKDSPDDGDEEDTDALLESKAKKYQTIKYPKELNELDKKQRQVSSNIDQLIDTLSRSTESANKRRKLNRKDLASEEERDERDPLMKAKRKRRHQQAEIKKYYREKPEIEKKEDEDSRVNFAKMLIHKEMMQDNQDADKLSASPANPAPITGVSGSNIVQGKRKLTSPKSKARKKRRSRNRGQVVDRTEISGGNENHDYKRPERNRDHIALIHELQKSRQAKSNMRSRIPMKLDPLAQRALDGEMGVRTQTDPDGDVLVKSNRDSLLTLKVPRDAASSSSSSSSNSDQDPSTESAGGYDDDNNSTSDGSSPEGDNSQLIDSVSLESPKPVKDEYPVSERVGERLNKLSRNLDRYFNDGFLQEVENKAKLREGDTDASKPLAESSNEISEKVPRDQSELAGDSAEKKVGGIKVDKDFDVDVGIDGKRDTDNKDNDENEDADDEPEDKVGDKSDDSGERDGERVKSKQVAHRQVGGTKRSTFEKVKRRKISADHNAGNQVDAINLQDTDPRLGESRGGSVKTALSVGKENLEFEGQAKMLPNLDPVDIETLETPIGPDGSYEPNVDKATAKKVQSSNTSDKVSAKYGKKVDGKFYEEPEWRS